MQEPIESAGDWRELIASIHLYAGRRLPVAILVVTIASVLEGIGLVMLLPISQLVFASETRPGSLSAKIDVQLNAWGFDQVIEKMALLCAVFLVVMLVRSVVLIHRDRRMALLTQGYVDYLRSRLFATIAYADWPVIRRMQRADLLNNMTTNIARISVAIQFLTRLLVTVTLVAAYVVSGFVVSPAIGLILLGVIALATATALVWSRRSGRLGETLSLRNRKVMNWTTRFLEGLKAAKVYGAETVFIGGFDAAIADTRAISIDFATQQGRMRRAIELLGAAAAVALLMIGYGLVGLKGAELLVMGAVIIRLVPTLSTALSGLQSVAFALPAYAVAERLRRDMERQRPNGREVDQPPARFDATPYPISLRDVTVTTREEGAEKTLLSAAHIDIPATGLVHVGGPSGAGKSTLAELLAGLYLPSAGTVVAGPLALTASQCPAWQARIAFAPQEPFLFDGSVRENLCWPNLAPSDAALWDALATAGAKDLVADLPEGLDHSIRDGGSRLSGGERQRLCLARTLLRPSAILIIDEATSAVDAALEAEIFERLRTLAETKCIICISHSTALNAMADYRIVIAEDGVAGGSV